MFVASLCARSAAAWRPTMTEVRAVLSPNLTKSGFRPGTLQNSHTDYTVITDYLCFTTSILLKRENYSVLHFAQVVFSPPDCCKSIATVVQLRNDRAALTECLKPSMGH